MPRSKTKRPSSLPVHSESRANREVSGDIAEEKLADQTDNVIPTRSQGMLPMVGLGGSAGSIGALQHFLGAMPVDSGMVFVVILHLSPEHESMLAETLQRSTTMRVVTAVDAVQVEANSVYVIPPAKYLSSADGQLRLSDLPHDRGKRVAVDFFFRTLADTHGSNSVAVVLSGADGDGAIGIKRIKERGGLTIAQDPDEAEHASMPRAAIATGMVDWVLEVKEMPGRLLAYMERRKGLRLPAEEGPHPAKQNGPSPDADETALREVLAFLHTRTARDFSYYKRATILRRIARRMQVNGVSDLPGYLVYLRTHAGEAGALLQDLLISVTNFFRDRGAFEALNGIMPELFKGKGPGDTVRVWVAACATGEEAYSVAMLLCEYARTLDAPPQLQIFATDLDDEVIRSARDGIYPETIIADVSEERLRRFFIKEHRGYRVRREVREVVLFALHDLLKDSPFSRLDLVTCRNLLIYLNLDAQRRAFDIFHFALKPGGYLFLGTSETVDEGSAHFVVTDKKHRLYVQRPGPRQLLPVPSGPSTLARSLEIQERSRERPTVPGRITVEGVATGPAAPGTGPFENAASWSELHYHLIERFAPPSALVDSSYEIVHLSESVGRFLQFSGGEPSRNLLRAVHPMLRVELRAALYSAAQTGLPATAFRVPIETSEGHSTVDLKVTPAGESAPGFLVVVFDASPAADSAPSSGGKGVEIDQATRHLERELETTKGQLRDTIEQSEASTEELKASNEELQAMNEELRSATEELETSREELQSINEELTTVNQEMKGKVDQLAHANSDLQNLMSATAIATVFLDRELRIMRYTPSAVSLFNFIPTDVGRPLTDLSHRLDYPDIVEDAEKALAHLTPTQREVRAGGQWLLARTLPYRTNDDRIAGVVFTFLDITARREAEDTLRESEARFRAIVSQAAAGVANVDLAGRITLVNPRFCEVTGYTEAELIGKSLLDLADPQELTRNTHRFQGLAAEGLSYDIETRYVRKDRTAIWVHTSVTDIRNAETGSRSAVVIVLDITKRRLAEAELIEAKQAAEAANRSKDRFLAVLSHELRTPLTPVLMAVASLEHDPDLRPDVREDLTMVKRNIELETKLIDDLLDLNRISSGKLELAIEPVDLNETVRHVCGICQSQVYERGTRLETKLQEGDAMIAADSARLQQVLWNVLKNAIKFSTEDGTIRVTTARLTNGRWQVRVQDGGIGIPAEILPHIFDAFEQGGTTVTKQFGGLGLGLAICKAVVELHRGSIRAESSGVGQGSTFIIELPGEAPGEVAKAADHASPHGSTRPLRLLLVEDHSDTARTLGRLLRAQGFSVVVASDVSAAAAAAQRERIDVLVSDLGLPDGSGFEVMDRVRAIRSVPGIAMSGYGMEEDKRRSLGAGFSEHLVKPIDAAQLIAAIHRVTDNRH